MPTALPYHWGDLAWGKRRQGRRWPGG